MDTDTPEEIGLGLTLITKDEIGNVNQKEEAGKQKLKTIIKVKQTAELADNLNNYKFCAIVIAQDNVMTKLLQMCCLKITCYLDVSAASIWKLS